MKLVQCAADEIPEALLMKKSAFRKGSFRKYAHSGWHCFLVVEDGEIIGAAVFIENKLYDAIAVDTLILEGRSFSRLREATQLVRERAHGIARTFGYAYVGVTTDRPEAFKRLLAGTDYDGYPVEVTLREEVKPEVR